METRKLSRNSTIVLTGALILAVVLTFVVIRSLSTPAAQTRVKPRALPKNLCAVAKEQKLRQILPYAKFTLEPPGSADEAVPLDTRCLIRFSRGTYNSGDLVLRARSLGSHYPSEKGATPVENARALFDKECAELRDRTPGGKDIPSPSLKGIGERQCSYSKSVPKNGGKLHLTEFEAIVLEEGFIVSTEFIDPGTGRTILPELIGILRTTTTNVS